MTVKEVCEKLDEMHEEIMSATIEVCQYGNDRRRDDCISRTIRSRTIRRKNPGSRSPRDCGSGYGAGYFSSRRGSTNFFIKSMRSFALGWKSDVMATTICLSRLT